MTREALIAKLKRATLKAGMMLYHGTDRPENFTAPHTGPVWFCDTFDGAAPWAGWGSTDAGGERRVLCFRLKQDVAILDQVAYKDYMQSCITLIGDPDPLIMDIAREVVKSGCVGWLGKQEIMLGDMSLLEYVETKPVPPNIKPYGRV